jgi:hypothetical protein
MCCFSPLAAPVGLLARLAGLFSSSRIEVRGTKIFARVEDGVQHLVYSMSLSTPADVAMVLPLPVAPGGGDEALSFVELSGYPGFFGDAWRMVMPELVFPAPLARGTVIFGLPPRPRLIVHDVGAFEASFVPSISDFDRLDPRFRLPDQVWSAHPEYGERGFGFAVFKLRKGRKKSIHPMALRFPTSEPDAIFFPTLHVHDQEVHPEADFDHELFYQVPEDGEATLERPDATDGTRLRSHALARDGMRIKLAEGLVAPDQAIHYRRLAGALANADTRLRVGSRPAEGRRVA